MWIVPASLRLSYAQALACSERALLLDFDTWASTAAASSTLNGKHTRAQSWKLAWKKAHWLQRLSGAAISPNSGSSSFAEWWIASLPASPAKTSVLRASVLGWTASDLACSSKLSASPPTAVRGSCFWRTSQASLLPPPPLWTRKKASLTSAPPPASWENWPTSGGMRSGSLWPRPTWAPAMAGRDGSASPGAWATPDCNTSSYSNGLMGPNIREQATNWMTPTAQDAEAAGGAGTISRGARGATLHSQMLRWPTPDVNSGNRDMSKVDPDEQRRPDTKVTIGLPTVASTWPTPSAAVVNDGESPETWHARAAKLKEKGINGNGAGLPLTVATAQWPTPMTRDHHAQGSGNQQKSPSLGTTTGQWPTPVSSDHKSQLGGGMPDRMNNRTASPSLSQVVTHSHCSPQGRQIHDGPPSSPSAPNSPRHLNPLFGAWLMGWPSTWVIAEPHASSALGTESYHSKLQQHLSCLFDEQEGRSHD